MKHANPPSDVKFTKVDAYVSHQQVIEIERDGLDDEGNPLDPLELEIEYGGNDFVDDSLTVHKTPDGYVVGYLVYDTDGESANPEEGDYNGHIGTSSTRDRRELNEIYQEAVGLTSNWDPKVSRWDLLTELSDNLDKPWDSLLRDPEKTITHDCKREDLKLPYRGKWDALIEEHRKAGDFGDPDRVTLDVYEHGGRVYSVGYNSGFPDRQWDCSYGGAVWVPDKYIRQDADAQKLKGKKRQEFMEKYATSLVESMNMWMNGAVYGVIVHKYDLEGALTDDNRDECWGYLGSDYAEKNLAEQVEWHLKSEAEQEAIREKNLKNSGKQETA